MRTKGALNKPKFVSIRLGDLCEFLSPETGIPIDIKFAQALANSNQKVKLTEIKPSVVLEKESTIDPDSDDTEKIPISFTVTKSA